MRTLILLAALTVAGCCPVNIVPNEVSCQTACRGAGGKMIASSQWWPYRCECDYSERAWPEG